MQQTPCFASSLTLLFDLFRRAALKATNTTVSLRPAPIIAALPTHFVPWMLLINTAVRLRFGFQALMQLRSPVWTHNSLPETPSTPLLHFPSRIIFRHLQKSPSYHAHTCAGTFSRNLGACNFLVLESFDPSDDGTVRGEVGGKRGGKTKRIEEMIYPLGSVRACFSRPFDLASS